MAIYKYFVSFFLVSNQEFYLKFNVPILHELHDLKKDDLVVVTDGTFCKIKKSKNNNYQYIHNFIKL